METSILSIVGLLMPQKVEGQLPSTTSAQPPAASRRGSSSEAIGRRRGGRGTSRLGAHVLSSLELKPRLP